MATLTTARMLFLLGALVSLVPAAESPARADSCDATAATVARLTGAVLAHREWTDIELKLTGLALFQVNCWPTDRDPSHAAGVALGIGNGMPPDIFFALLGTAGEAVTGVPAAQIKRGAIACQQKALATDPDQGDDGLMTVLHARGLRFACMDAVEPAPGRTIIGIDRDGEALPLGNVR